MCTLGVLGEATPNHEHQERTMRPRVIVTVTGVEVERGDHVNSGGVTAAVIKVIPSDDGYVYLWLRANSWDTDRQAKVLKGATVTVSRPDPYIRARFTNRVTGSEIEVIDANDEHTEFEPDDMGDAEPLRWYTICRTHGILCSHSTLEAAMSHAAEPDGWCEPCRDIVDVAHLVGA